MLGIEDIIKVFLPATVAFAVGIGITPLVTAVLYKYKLWKRSARTQGLAGYAAPIFNSLHKTRETKTPRMGGVVIWGSVVLTTAAFALFSGVSAGPWAQKLDFLSANQTLLPLAVLLAAAFVGLFDDLLQIFGGGTYIAGGLSLTRRILLVLMIGLAAGLWFYLKLRPEFQSIHVPFVASVDLGILFVPFFMLVVLSLFAGGVIDGIDGLAGGVMASVFAAYAGIAFFQNQIDLAALCAVFVGGILAFLWFNIPPARFYMGETGMMGLTAALAVIAFLTQAVVPLIVIALPLFAASGSNIIQLASKRFRRGKKVFLVAPIHHHFEAVGWPPEKVTMRFWVVSVVFSILGMIIALVG